MRNQHSRILIIIVMVLSIASIAFSHYRPEFTGPIRSAFSFVVVPIQKRINDIGMFFVEKVTNRWTLQQAEQRILELEQQVASLSETNNILKQQSYENDRLRKLYQLSNEYGQYKKVAARIIAKESHDWFQQFKIDKGSKDGIKVDMNVLSKNGLCGIVTYVGYNYSTVRSIIDDESIVSAMTQHSLESCMVEGDVSLYHENRLRLSGMKLSSTIANGDKIVTANISTKYLPNIVIGYADNITLDDNQLTKSGYVIPVTDFGNLTEVLIITTLKSEFMRDEQ